jgi:hypothetical protein
MAGRRFGQPDKMRDGLGKGSTAGSNENLFQRCPRRCSVACKPVRGGLSRAALPVRLFRRGRPENESRQEANYVLQLSAACLPCTGHGDCRSGWFFSSSPAARDSSKYRRPELRRISAFGSSFTERSDLPILGGSILSGAGASRMLKGPADAESPALRCSNSSDDSLGRRPCTKHHRDT